MGSEQSDSRAIRESTAAELKCDQLASVLFRAAMSHGCTDPNLSGPWQADTTRWAFDLTMPGGQSARVNIAFQIGG